MGVLDQVTQMRRENRSDEEIISALKNQGISPKDINNALMGANIRKAVGTIQGDDMQAPSPQDMTAPVPGNYAEEGYEEYAPEAPQYPQEQVYTPQPQQAYYPQEQGYGQDYYAPQTNTDTIVEIASQVFEEKISEISRKIDSSEEFKVLTSAKLEHINERLKRIEMVIDRLQSAILEKIGAYGSNIESIKKEMSMMQDSFSKVVGQKIERRQEISEEKSSKKRK